MPDNPRGRSQNPFRGRSANRMATPPSQTSGVRQRSPSAESFPSLPATPSLDDNASDSDAPPPVLISPIKRRARAAAPNINRMSDLDVWKMSDFEIIGKSIINQGTLEYQSSNNIISTDAARTTWRSDAYNHYDITLQREYDPEDGKPLSLTFVFTCPSNPHNHKPMFRPRTKTGEGTSNLVRTMNLCLESQGIDPRTKSAADGAQPIYPYSYALHRALIALRCAKNSRPFNMVSDKDYLTEVQMLRPGVIMPRPRTVSDDVNSIYLEVSRHVQQYFLASLYFMIIWVKLIHLALQNLNSMVHLVLDGWTSPLVSSYLGLVIIWYENGAIHRAILEFLRCCLY